MCKWQDTACTVCSSLHCGSVPKALFQAGDNQGFPSMVSNNVFCSTGKLHRPVIRPLFVSARLAQLLNAYLSVVMNTGVYGVMADRVVQCTTDRTKTVHHR